MRKIGAGRANTSRESNAPRNGREQANVCGGAAGTNVDERKGTFCFEKLAGSCAA
jgi:hypothetical protein